MTENDGETLVPWKHLPVSEPVLAGEFSHEVHRAKGWPIWYPAMITIVAGILIRGAPAAGYG